jgi:PPOX class probable F420-dependent enzyme
MIDADLPNAVSTWLAAHRQVVLVTVRRDGTPQSSNVAAAFDPESSTFRISVTDDRAKTRNLRRDPRAVVHVLGDDFWSYCAVTGEASLSPVSSEPGDATGQELLELYNSLSRDPHPGPDEFFRAMVDERRLVLRVRATSYVGNNLPSDA